MIPKGEMVFHSFQRLAELSEVYGDKRLHTTNRQNIEIQGVRGQDRGALKIAIHELGFRTERVWNTWYHGGQDSFPARLLNGPHGRRLRFVMRVLVRNLSALVLRPNLIDEVWNYSIDLAEVKVRGSAIVNEIRRSCHHALGPRTLRLSRAYLAYLEAGATEPLAELGYETRLTGTPTSASPRAASSGWALRITSGPWVKPDPADPARRSSSTRAATWDAANPGARWAAHATGF